MTKTTVNIRGKEYETVASRVSRFKAEHKDDYAIRTILVERDAETVVMRAVIVKVKDGQELVMATGHAEERRASSTINKTSALENCETSAIGRALAAFGMAGTEFASADEVATAIKNQGAQNGSTQLTGPATDKQKEVISRHLTALGYATEEQSGYLIETYGVEIPLTKEGASFVIDQMFNNK